MLGGIPKRINKASKSLLFIFSITTFFSLISGCQTTSNTELKNNVPFELAVFPRDLKFTGEDIVDTQLALADRNLYLMVNDRIKMLDPRKCEIDISAHRGDFREAENGADAIASALFDNFNSVEIDVMQIRDGSWVNYHDKYTGRAAVYPTGVRYKVEDMSRVKFNRLKIRDKNSREMLNETPMMARRTFQAFNAFRGWGESLNVEVKSDSSKRDLKKLNNMLRKTIGAGNFYYSSMNRDVLLKLRALNPHVYIGFIQGAHPASVSKLKSSLRRGVKNDEFYRHHKGNLEFVGDIGGAYYSKSKYQNYTSDMALLNLHKDFGSNSGLHLDIRRYAETPSVKKRAHMLGMKIYTYTINGSDYHQSLLVKLKKSLPDGAIVDATPFRVCQRLFNASKKKGLYKPVSNIGRYIASLPDDADFDQMSEMMNYMDEGYYISLTKGLKRISGKRAAVVKLNNLDAEFPKHKDEGVDTRPSESIKINVRGGI